jgi:hypothetical protein
MRTVNIHEAKTQLVAQAQAQVEGVTLLTADPQVAGYAGPVRKV